MKLDSVNLYLDLQSFFYSKFIKREDCWIIKIEMDISKYISVKYLLKIMQYKIVKEDFLDSKRNRMCI